MTNEELAAIRHRLASATPGPWEAISDSDGWAVAHRGQFYARLGTGSIEGAWPRRRIEADQQFIAHAPADMTALLAEVARLRAREAALREIAQAVADGEVYHDSKGGMLIIATPDALVTKARALVSPLLAMEGDTDGDA